MATSRCHLSDVLREGCRLGTVTLLKQVSVAVAVVAAGAAAFYGATEHTMVMGNVEYVCPNGCVVSQGPKGAVVRDIAGARVAKAYVSEVTAETIEIDNIEYVCPNSCVMTEGPNGPLVRDSAGAKVAKAEAPQTTVAIGNTEYICPNSCVVTRGAEGPVVSDSEGGRVAQGYLSDAYVLHNEPRPQALTR